MSKEKIKIGFFGTPEHAVKTLEKLRGAGFDIAFVVTQPDRPQGRKLVLTPPPVKVWAEKNKVPVYQPEKLKDPEFKKQLTQYQCDVFVVLAYGKIIPEEILNIPKYQSLNIHGSLLPKYRGSCPIESAILNDDQKTGVTIIRMDKEMDHGPIVAKEEVVINPWPPTTDLLREKNVEAGTNLLISILPNWVEKKIEEKEQDHSHATYTKMIEKEDGLIDLSDDPYKNYLKIQAYHGWPSAFFFEQVDGKKIRVKITEAVYQDGELEIRKVVPEGKKEMNYRDWSADSIAK